MNYKQLQRRVDVAERRVESRGQQTVEHWVALKRHWREGWTPTRIIAAGLVSGFVSGRAEPLRALTGPRLVQMIGALSGLFASAQAAAAAGKAEDAADTAQAVATDQAVEAATVEAAVADEPAPYQYEPPSARSTGTPDPVFQTQPRAAEASTEVSER